MPNAITLAQQFKLIAKGIFKGRDGADEALVLDMSEDAVRLLVILDRAGVFGA